MALNSAHAFSLSIANPSTAMFSCLVEMLLYRVTDTCSSVSFIKDPSSSRLGIKARLGKAWPLDACMQSSTAEKRYRTLKEDLKRQQNIIWNAESDQDVLYLSLLVLRLHVYTQEQLHKLFNMGFPMRRCILAEMANLGLLGSL